MKKVIKFVFALTFISTLLLSVACKKDSDKENKGLYSFSNTEYTGLANVGNPYFPRPLSLRFSEGNDVAAWSHLTLSVWR